MTASRPARLLTALPWKPWYVWRPSQLAVRAWRACRNTPSGYHPISVAWGSSIVADPATTVGRSLWTTGIHDIAVSEVLVRLIQSGDRVIDAGAHVGYMTVLAGIAAAESGSVIAFEPHPTLFALLQQNTTRAASTHRIASVSLRNTALGDRTGDALLRVPDGFSSNDGIARIHRDEDRGIAVRMERLDDVLGAERVAVLKIDVEGYELPVLRGAASALAAHRIRHIIFEDFDGGGSEASRFLESFGYRLHAIGWSVRRLQLAPASRGSKAKSYEAPSYLATIDERDALARCAEPGWRVLRNPSCASRS